MMTMVKYVFKDLDCQNLCKWWSLMCCAMKISEVMLEGLDCVFVMLFCFVLFRFARGLAKVKCGGIW